MTKFASAGDDFDARVGGSICRWQFRQFKQRRLGKGPIKYGTESVVKEVPLWASQDVLVEKGRHETTFTCSLAYDPVVGICHAAHARVEVHAIVAAIPVAPFREDSVPGTGCPVVNVVDGIAGKTERDCGLATVLPARGDRRESTCASRAGN